MTLNQIKLLNDGLKAIENNKSFKADEKAAVEVAKKVIRQEIKAMKKEKEFDSKNKKDDDKK